MTPKRLIILIAIIVFIVLVVAGVLFWDSSKNNSSDTETPFGIIGDRPFGTTTQEVLASLPNDWLGTTTTPEVARLRRVSVGPVASAVPFLLETGSSSEERVRFVMRASGDIQETPLARTETPTTIAQKTIIRIGAGGWDKNASSTLVLFSDTSGETAYSFLGTLSRTTSTADMRYAGRPLPNDITSFAFSPDGKRLVYTLQSGGKTELFVEEVKTGIKKRLASFPLRHILVQWDAPKIVIAYPAPATQATGVLWSIDPDTGVSQVLMREKKGLSAKTDAVGKKLLVSFIEPTGSVTLQVADMDAKEVTLLPVPTFTDKCVWGRDVYVYCATPRNIDAPFYIEGRLQGTILSDDILWRFDTQTGEAKRLIDPREDATVPLDIADLALSPYETFLTFRSFEDSSLWAVRLPEEEKKATTTATSSPTRS